VDDELNIPGRFGILMGSELYPYLMKKGCYKYGKNHPVLQETHLRWILLVRPCKNQEGVCLNGMLMNGQAIQQELLSIVLRF